MGTGSGDSESRDQIESVASFDCTHVLGRRARCCVLICTHVFTSNVPLAVRNLGLAFIGVESSLRKSCTRQRSQEGTWSTMQATVLAIEFAMRRRKLSVRWRYYLYLCLLGAIYYAGERVCHEGSQVSPLFYTRLPFYPPGLIGDRLKTCCVLDDCDLALRQTSCGTFL